MSTNNLQGDKQALLALSKAVRVLSLSANAQDLCRRIAHSEFMDGFCQGVAIFLLDQKSDLVEVASYGRGYEFPHFDSSAWSDSIIAKAIRARKITTETNENSTLFALPIELAGVTTGAFLFTLTRSLPSPIFSDEVTKMLSNLGGLFMSNQGLSLRQSQVINANEGQSQEEFLPVQELTTRQMQIIKFMADGLTNAEISKLVLLSESTVRQETIRIFRILKCHTRSEAIVKARASGIIAKVQKLDEVQVQTH